MLLQQATSQMARIYFGSVVWITTGMTLLATFTPPCPPPGFILRVISVDNLVYARAVIPEAYTSIVDSYSEDGGQSWQFISQVPAKVAQELAQEVRLPQIVCDPINIQLCYRIAVRGQVEESMDGGRSWRVAWRLPEARRSYMERVVYCGKPIEPGPHDLALIEQDEMSTLIVAAGSEGVLVRTPAGVWERYTVVPGYALGPTPYFAENISTAISVVAIETGIWLLTGLFTLLYLLRRGRAAMLEATRAQVESARGPDPRSTGLSILAAIGIFPLAWLPFPFWALGIISHYEFALALSILLTGLILWWGIRQAEQPNAQRPPHERLSA